MLLSSTQADMKEGITLALCDTLPKWDNVRANYEVMHAFTLNSIDYKHFKTQQLSAELILKS